VGRFGKTQEKALYRESAMREFLLPPGHTHELIVIGPPAFLKQIADMDRDAVERRLAEQASAIGVPVSELLDRLAGLIPGFVSILRKPGRKTSIEGRRANPEY
jgi:hypothetical protein